MSKAVYIATMEHGSGKSIISLGLMRMLLGKVAKVGYFKPIISDFQGEERDNHINTMRTYFNLDIACEDAYAFTKSEVLEKKHAGKIDEVLDKIIEKYKALEEKYDFVLVEGTDFSGEGTSVELEINSDIAKNLGIPAILVEKGTGKTMDEFINEMAAAYDMFEENDVRVLSIVANMVQPENIDWVKENLTQKMGKDVLINVIPKIDNLGNPTIKEVIKELDAEVLFGEEKELNNLISHTIVGAMQLRNFLPRLKKNTLIVVPGDRADLVMGALQANISSNYPALAGIILSGGLVPEPAVVQLADGLPIKLPILLAKADTYSCAQQVSKIHPQIYASNTEKIQLSIQSFDKYVDSENLAKALITFEPKGITPRMFQYNLLKWAQKEKKRIVLPEGDDDRILTAAARLINQNVVDLTILGKKDKIQKRVKQIGLKFDLAKVEIINPIDSPHFKDYVKTFYELRKHKKVNMAIAEDKMLDVSYFGTMMVYKGHADGMVSGAKHATQHTILPALQFIKTKPGVSVVSSIFFMCLEDRVSVFGDCAINPNPNAQQLAEIAISSADSSKAFGIEPKIAMLSYSSGHSGIGEDVERVREATELVKKLRPDLKIEGPIQYDAAVDPYIAGNKMPDSEVAGQASVLIFPDLNTGNNTYKAVQRETGTIAIGPMLQGLNKPVNDLSRGCLIDDIYNTVIITAIQAQANL
ncbi:MAG TPA: phosphate acetyltransferase [Saprospiraceae bacterium]|nr:phosphate acetyltransferase [Saprospiraceae bacterium]